MTTRRSRSVHVALAGVALVAAALAAASGDASSRPSSSSGDEVTALQLARWIRDARPNLRVIDLRDSVSFEAFSIPGAERITEGQLDRVKSSPDAEVVLYGDSDDAARRAQRALRSAGVQNVRILEDGMLGWINGIAAPVLPANPTSQQKVASREIADMSRWFGGVPRVSDSPSNGDSLRAAIGRIRRRGC